MVHAHHSNKRAEEEQQQRGRSIRWSSALTVLFFALIVASQLVTSVRFLSNIFHDDGVGNLTTIIANDINNPYAGKDLTATTSNDDDDDGDNNDNQNTRQISCNELQGTCCFLWDGPNTDEWWTHHPDWEVGAENTTHYCYSKIKDPARAKFLQKVYQVQWHGNCSEDVQQRIVNAGYGASVETIVEAFYATMKSYRFQRPFQMTKPRPDFVWLYTTNDNSSCAYCNTTDMNCYVLPLSKCPPVYGRPNDRFPKENDKQNEAEFSWLHGYTNRLRLLVRKQVFDTLKHKYPKAKLPCTVMHIRRGDVGLWGGPWRRYAAVAEYIEKGQVQKGENIVLLTDDDTTIEEIKKYHSWDYNWIYSDRPRQTGTRKGFNSHIASNVPALDYVAILAELKLASQCHKFVYGYSGFARIIVEALREAGTNFTEYYLDTTISNEEAKAQGGQRGIAMLRSIEEQMVLMKNAT